jgi:coproporphyrinogen III oxidase
LCNAASKQVSSICQLRASPASQTESEEANWWGGGEDLYPQHDASRFTMGVMTTQRQQSRNAAAWAFSISRRSRWE